MGPNRKQTFFGIIELDITVGRAKIHEAIDPPTVIVTTKPISRLVGQESLSVTLFDPKRS